MNAIIALWTFAGFGIGLALGAYLAGLVTDNAIEVLREAVKLNERLHGGWE